MAINALNPPYPCMAIYFKGQHSWVASHFTVTNVAGCVGEHWWAIGQVRVTSLPVCQFTSGIG